MGERLAYTVKEAAAAIGVSEVQVRRMIKRGAVKVKREGRRVIIPAAALDDYLNGAQ